MNQSELDRLFNKQQLSLSIYKERCQVQLPVSTKIRF